MVGKAIRFLIYPSILSFALYSTYLLDAANFGEMANALSVYVGISLLIFTLEQLLPYKPEWNDPKGDYRIDSQPFLNDILHGVLVVITHDVTQFSLFEPLFTKFQSPLAHMWEPLPFFVQVYLCGVFAEFGAYWSHRLSHTCSWLWPFHAIHHQVLRLQVLNTPRFHFFDTFTSLIMLLPMPYLFGFSGDVVFYYMALYTVVGQMSHCNIDTYCSFFNFIFNTPETHRIHHWRTVKGSNSNYSELFNYPDLFYGTFILPQPSDRETRIGRTRYQDGESFILPKTITGQLLVPFTSNPLFSGKKSFMKALLESPKSMS